MAELLSESAAEGHLVCFTHLLVQTVVLYNLVDIPLLQSERLVDSLPVLVPPNDIDKDIFLALLQFQLHVPQLFIALLLELLVAGLLQNADPQLPRLRQQVEQVVVVNVGKDLVLQQPFEAGYFEEVEHWQGVDDVLVGQVVGLSVETLYHSPDYTGLHGGCPTLKASGTTKYLALEPMNCLMSSLLGASTSLCTRN